MEKHWNDPARCVPQYNHNHNSHDMNKNMHVQHLGYSSSRTSGFLEQIDTNYHKLMISSGTKNSSMLILACDGNGHDFLKNLKAHPPNSPAPTKSHQIPPDPSSIHQSYAKSRAGWSFPHPDLRPPCLRWPRRIGIHGGLQQLLGALRGQWRAGPPRHVRGRRGGARGPRQRRAVRGR